MKAYDDRDGALSVALAELADTMPEDPNRVEGIHARARRFRTRRRAARAGIGVVVGAATIAGIVAIRPGPSAVSTVPASAVTDQAPALPACGTLPPAALTPDPATTSSPDDSRKAAAAEAGSRAATYTGPGGQTGVKGYGTVTAVSDTSVSVTLGESPPGAPPEVTAAFTTKTSFYDGDTEVTDRPAVAVGDPVAIAAVVNASGGYDLILFDAHPAAPDTSKPTTGEISDAKKAAAATAPAGDGSYVKGMAAITAVEPGSVTLDVKDGPLAGQSIAATLAPDIIYTVGDQKCVDPALAAGQNVGFLLVRGDGGAYTLQQVALFG